MSKQTDEPKDRSMKLIHPAQNREFHEDESDMMEDGFMDDMDWQEEDVTSEILAKFNHHCLEETFSEDSMNDDEHTLEFSQKFIDGMYDMVADRFGQEAADQFMIQNHYTRNQETNNITTKITNNICDDTCNVESDTEKTFSQSSNAPLSKTVGTMETDHTTHHEPNRKLFTFARRFARIAAVLIIGGVIFGAYQVSVIANKTPTADISEAASMDYSQVGSPEDVITMFDMSGYLEELKDIYEPSCIADGCSEVVRNLDKQLFDILYDSNTDAWYRYQQMTVTFFSYLDSEDGEWEKIAIGEYPGFYIENEDGGKLWWFDYNYAYEIVGDLSKGDMVKIAESLVQVKD